MKYNSLSFGVDHLNKDLAWNKNFIYKNKDYIKNIFMCIPDEKLAKFFTAKSGYISNPVDVLFYQTLIDYAKSLNIKINFTLNANDGKYFMKFKLPLSDYLNRGLNIIKNYQPDELCVIDENIEFFKQNYPNAKYCRTFIEGVPNKAKLKNLYDLYDIFVLKNSFIINNNLFSNKENRIILNIGCPISCFSCAMDDGSPNYHIKQFYKEFIDMESYLAMHLWLGRDIVLFENNFSQYNLSYKLISRVKNYKLFDQIMDIYINNLTIEDIIKLNNKNLINELCDTSGLQLEIFKFDFNKFDFNKFYNIKNTLWKSINISIDY